MVVRTLLGPRQPMLAELYWWFYRNSGGAIIFFFDKKKNKTIFGSLQYIPCLNVFHFNLDGWTITLIVTVPCHCLSLTSQQSYCGSFYSIKALSKFKEEHTTM